MIATNACNAAIPFHKALRLATLGLVLTVGAARADGRVVAVGDVHGDIESFVAILREANLIDKDRRWTGRKTVLVQTGDFLDRGPAEVEVMDLLRSLQSQASQSGGKVIVLLGNHETLNLMGDFRYVSAESFAAFADASSELRREQAFQDYVRFLKKKAARETAEPVVDESFRKSWMEQHPPGYLERIEALEGKYGNWLRHLPAAAKVQDTIFVHGGIHPDLAALSLDDINRRVRKELEAFEDYRELLVRRGVILPFFSLREIQAAATEELDRVRGMLPVEGIALRSKATDRQAAYAKLLDAFVNRNWMINHPDGPLWFRGYAEWREEGEARLQALLESYQAQRIVVGHTPVLQGGIRERFGGKAFLIDTGMLSDFYSGGRASALEIQGGRVRPIYLAPNEDGEPPQKESTNRKSPRRASRKTSVQSAKDRPASEEPSIPGASRR